MLAVEWDCAFIKERLILIDGDLRASEIGKYRIYQACVICLCLLLFGSHKALSSLAWRDLISRGSRLDLSAWLGFISWVGAEGWFIEFAWGSKKAS